MSRPGAPQREQVVVVDDHDDARLALCHMVDAAGFRAVTAAVQDAVDVVDRTAARILVVSVESAEGAELALAAIVARQAPHGAYVIAACPDDHAVLDAVYGVGVQDVIIGPIRPSDVAARLRAASRNWVDAARADLMADEARRRQGTMATVLQAMSEALVLVGRDGRVEETNAAMARLVGRPARDIVGARPPYSWWPSADADDVDRLVAGAVTAGGGEINAAVERPDGTKVQVEIHVAVDRAAPRDGHTLVLRDLTEQNRHRAALQSARREHASLRRIATAVAGEPDVERVFGLIASELADVFAVECGVVVRFVKDVAVVAGTPSARAFYSAGAVLPGDFDAAVARVVATGAPTRVAYEYLPSDVPAAAAREAGAVCSVAAPITVAGRQWGAALISTRYEAGIADERARLAGFADMAALALETSEARRRMEMVATIDELTGLPNRRAFDDAIARETERARRYDRPLTLVMFDIDRLGQLNEAFGHDVGDDAIERFSTILTDCCRLTDMVARTGGAEFVCLMPDTEGRWGTAYAERVRAAVAEADMPQGFTCSAGVAQWRDVEDAESVVARAGQALYRAKHQGRDRVASEDPQAA